MRIVYFPPEVNHQSGISAITTKVCNNIQSYKLHKCNKILIIHKCFLLKSSKLMEPPSENHVQSTRTVLQRYGKVDPFSHLYCPFIISPLQGEDISQFSLILSAWYFTFNPWLLQLHGNWTISEGGITNKVLSDTTLDTCYKENIAHEL